MNEGSTADESGADFGVASPRAELVERLARKIIAETGEWKEGIQRRGPMVVTRHGKEACEITIPKDAHHPDWIFQRRMLTESERASFLGEYGRAGHHLILSQNMGGGNRQVRGFILNGRMDGWQLSVGEVEIA